ncbi:putative PPOX class F420-dependent enzyme [Frankia sp. AiPs1]|uniref:PPOX class F420-dependent oxidoreductase n=1 Tax=Frankia sp. AiPa1 TaxID=573492 RepID=UPI00202B26C1|nr:PPOX class F420-dependent oxidoreductase [Frankia sp. AiPa1]MCL9760528.1 PPOX class F420-dependent oxidoreductase [Frankia sp. AiPa1]
MPTVSPGFRDLLEEPIPVTLATVGEGGQPQVTAVWALLEDDVVRLSLTTDRQKYRNLARHPRVTLFVIDPGNPQRTLEIRATAEIGEDPDLAFLKRILAKYGTDLEHFPAPTENRVVVTLNPNRIVELG